jgi:hypothetical protein
MCGAISYLDFYLLLSRTERGYRAQVLSSPAGEASSDFVAPFSDLELDNFVLRIGRPRRNTRRTGSPEMEAIKTLGKGLYEAVFTGDVKACWSASLAEAEAQNAGLRLRLRIAEAPELNDVPWEYLYNASLNRFLSLSEYTPLIRYLDLPERIRPLPVDGRLEILVIIASPTDYPGLDVENEWSVERGLGRAHQQRPSSTAAPPGAAVSGAAERTAPRRISYPALHRARRLRSRSPRRPARLVRRRGERAARRGREPRFHPA